MGVLHRSLVGDLEEGAGTLHPDEEHFWRKSSTFFVTDVMALPSLQDMGM